ncbi:hypothetical protein K491DRAFT_673566 [Lophiostoma macrostomum CBS 122681]|uniref:Uncharacterized protein n=1 Tax=Lophiostoma macrostomum CBS 122681 TaxID=1314788 RepID=A0A6A6TSY7_9PLEO|nr:hypothetical protein K491DRAFT_673566 [Lophiostoma macrostomum CBS 122681]
MNNAHPNQQENAFILRAPISSQAHSKPLESSMYRPASSRMRDVNASGSRSAAITSTDHHAAQQGYRPEPHDLQTLHYEEVTIGPPSVFAFVPNKAQPRAGTWRPRIATPAKRKRPLNNTKLALRQLPRYPAAESEYASQHQETFSRPQETPDTQQECTWTRHMYLKKSQSGAGMDGSPNTGVGTRKCPGASPKSAP